MDRTLKLYARAKINLTLAVTGKRSDGYHTLSSVMQQVSLKDTITMHIGDGEGVFLKSNLVYLPSDSRNLCVRAAQLYLDEANLKYRVDMQISKRIPVAAGLGGGSSDAAAVLSGLESVFHAFGSDLPVLALRLGADVPFCLQGGVCLCEGIGENLTPLESRAGKTCIVIAKNVKGLSTPYIYQQFDAMAEPVSPVDNQAVFDALRTGDVSALAAALRNDLEAVSLREKPEIATLKNRLLSLSAVGAMMSGSGPSVFGLFLREADAKAAVKALREEGAGAYFATFI